MIKAITLILSLFTISLVIASSKVRRVVVTNDQIISVRTALGIATIIQVPESPSSVVIGDQESFKVEYLDQAVTIKPLTTSAKTNLYIYTESKRYNVELITGSEALSDYVVYLENPKRKEDFVPMESTDNVNWIDFKNVFRNDELFLETKRVAKLKNGILQIEFYLTGEKRVTLAPEWIWLTQNGKTKPIHNLILSSLEIKPQERVQGVLQVLASDLDKSQPFRIEMRRKKLSYLTVKKVDSWK